MIISLVAVKLARRVPVGCTLLISGTLSFAVTRCVDTTLQTPGTRLYDIGSSYLLSAVPPFFLMGHILMAHMAIASGLIDDMYKAAR